MECKARSHHCTEHLSGALFPAKEARTQFSELAQMNLEESADAHCAYSWPGKMTLWGKMHKVVLRMKHKVPLVVGTRCLRCCSMWSMNDDVLLCVGMRRRTVALPAPFRWHIKSIRITGTGSATSACTPMSMHQVG